MVDNKITEAVVKSYDGRNTKVKKNSQQNNLDTVANENDREIPKKIYTYLQKKTKKY